MAYRKFRHTVREIANAFSEGWLRLVIAGKLYLGEQGRVAQRIDVRWSSRAELLDDSVSCRGESVQAVSEAGTDEVKVCGMAKAWLGSMARLRVGQV